MIKAVTLVITLSIFFNNAAASEFNRVDANLVYNSSEIYSDVFFDGMLSYSYLGKFNNKTSIFYNSESQGPHEFIYQLKYDNQKNSVIVDCIYVKSREFLNGIMFHGMKCNLDLPLSSEIIGVNLLENEMKSLNLDRINTSPLQHSETLKFRLAKLDGINIFGFYSNINSFMNYELNFYIQREVNDLIFIKNAYISYDEGSKINGLFIGGEEGAFYSSEDLIREYATLSKKQLKPE